MSKQIILKNLKLKNFKGIKKVNIDFDFITNIYGDNGTGKTTIFDAFTWLLFDKDSKDRSGFEIKTLDLKGQGIHGLEHEVEGVLSVDDREINLKKILKEKWTKKKGEAKKKLTGHEILYFINEVPVKQSEYKAKISEIVDESIFKLISSPIYFGINLKWQDRRKVLLNIIGDIGQDKVIASNAELSPLTELLKNTDAETLKKSIAVRKKKLNDYIKAIPIRIDECNNLMVNLNFDELTLKNGVISFEIKGLEEWKNDKVSTRITELKAQEEKLAEQIAALEEQELLCDKFIKTKVELLESSINQKFKFVTFKLFNTLINGAVEECCEALINGVPFSCNANTASQINGGLDIINALSEYYKTYAPIFIDNRESVNKIIASNSQIINLLVSNDKELKVEKAERADKIDEVKKSDNVKKEG